MKTCPFKHYELGEPLLIKNVEIGPEEINELRDARPALIKIRDGSNTISIEPLYAACNEDGCALWNDDRHCCSLRAKQTP